MNRWMKWATITTLSLFAAGVTYAEEKADKEKTARAKDGIKADGRKATSQPAYRVPKRVPKSKDWIQLFNGTDLKGWKSFPADRPNSWKVVNGILQSKPGPEVKPEEWHGTNIYTEKQFKDFEIYYEYKVPENGNSGVFLRGLFEIQIKADYGIPVDQLKEKADWGNGGIYGQKTASKNASKPASEWQAVYARMIGNKITVFLNGEKIHDEYQPPGPTHVYKEMKDVKAKETGPGPIILQGDHRPIEFRAVAIRPIEKK